MLELKIKNGKYVKFGEGAGRIISKYKVGNTSGNRKLDYMYKVETSKGIIALSIEDFEIISKKDYDRLYNTDISEGEISAPNSKQQGILNEKVSPFIRVRNNQLIKSVKYKVEVEYYPERR